MGALTLVAVVAVVAARSISPSVARSRTRPPAVVPVLAKARVAPLTETVELTCTPSRSSSIDVVAGTGQATADGGVSAEIVTAHPLAVGADVTEGSVVAVVSGRPVIALTGALPAYRDLKPGDVGPDVGQLQAALLELHLISAGFRLGTFDVPTSQAVRDLYASVGFDPVLTGVGDQDPDVLIANARGAVTAAQRALSRARRDAESAPSADADDSVAQAAAALEQAVSARDRTVDRAGATLPRSEVVFVPLLPATLVAAPVPVGSSVSNAEAIVTIGAGPTVLKCPVTPSQAAVVKPNMAATFDAADGSSGSGVVSSLEKPPREPEGSASSNSGDSKPAAVQDVASITLDAPVSSPGPTGVSEVQAVVTVRQSAAPVLSVPSSAVRRVGGVDVVAMRRSGQFVLVEVRVIDEAGGWVHVDPVRPDSGLADGSVVRVA